MKKGWWDWDQSCHCLLISSHTCLMTFEDIFVEHQKDIECNLSDYLCTSPHIDFAFKLSSGKSKPNWKSDARIPFGLQRHWRRNHLNRSNKICNKFREFETKSLESKWQDLWGNKATGDRITWIEVTRSVRKQGHWRQNHLNWSNMICNKTRPLETESLESK